ncbi:hypothetical protein [Smaragdicoccus niigatensis]|uniref:hypothetical protein n=1 Tax=Smaragdicoccus niigatensis TaxID=359359 RepID=UPI00037DC0FC|nr:hypothetical protein [Smaragdicoccus niigatensis]
MTQSPKRGGTRWRRCVILLFAPMIGILGMAALTLTGITPLNLAITGQDFKLASRPGSYVVVEQGATGYADLITMKDGSVDPALKAKLDSADISDGVCLSLVLTFPLIGTYTVQLQTTGHTVITDMTGYVDRMGATGVELNARTNDGKPPRDDMSNVTAPVRINKDASKLDIAGGHAGTLGLEAPGAVRAKSLFVGGKGATIRGTLSIGGIKFPWISHGRGTAHGECY